MTRSGVEQSGGVDGGPRLVAMLYFAYVAGVARGR